MMSTTQYLKDFLKELYRDDPQKLEDTLFFTTPIHTFFRSVTPWIEFIPEFIKDVQHLRDEKYPVEMLREFEKSLLPDSPKANKPYVRLLLSWVDDLNLMEEYSDSKTIERLSNYFYSPYAFPLDVVAHWICDLKDHPVYKLFNKDTPSIEEFSKLITDLDVLKWIYNLGLVCEWLKNTVRFEKYTLMERQVYSDLSWGEVKEKASQGNIEMGSAPLTGIV